jgi:thioester reductase-like protein
MPDQAVFFTGAGGFIGRRILSYYLEQPDCILYLLERGSFRERLETMVAARVKDPDRRARIHIFDGDITQPNLGLDAKLADEIQSTATRAMHLAAVYDLSVPKDVGYRINVDGTRNVLDFLGKAKHMERFGYMSTVAISGLFRGTFTEDDFDAGQAFKNHYEETKFLAEKVVRERRDTLPTVIFRPTIVVGDSQTGEFEKIDGPYFSLAAISRNLHLIMPDFGEVLCNIEPIDFVAKAIYHLLEDPESTGQVYQIADPDPVTYNRFLDLACDQMHKIRPLIHVPPSFVAPFTRMKPISKLLGVNYDAYQYSCQPVRYGTSKSGPALAKHGIVCPPLPSYIQVMIKYYMKHCRDARVRRGEIYKDVT